ncbi:MAG TPA: hypothetical protein VK993_14215 [Chthoniobacterales bacterium]|nr:hypothetical protein [Chthoniobacterales bacterium]
MKETPFVPFAIRTSDGQEYPVPTVDHVWLIPGGSRVAVADDKGFRAYLSPLHMTAIVEHANGAESHDAAAP